MSSVQFIAQTPSALQHTASAHAVGEMLSTVEPTSGESMTVPALLALDAFNRESGGTTSSVSAAPDRARPGVPVAGGVAPMRLLDLRIKTLASSRPDSSASTGQVDSAEAPVSTQGAEEKPVAAASEAPVRFKLNKPIDPKTAEELWDLLQSLRSKIPGIPTEKTTDETRKTPAIYYGIYNGSIYMMNVRPIERPLLETLQKVLREEFKKRGMNLEPSDNHNSLTITASGVSKGKAVKEFAETIGVDPQDILRFGDQPYKGGNDETLVVGLNGFDVGNHKKAADPHVHKTAEPFADGTVAVLSGLDPKEVKAIATDYDRTLTTEKDYPKFDPEACDQVARYLKAGTKIAIVTGRGPSIFGLVIPELLKRDLSLKDLDNLVFAICNASVFVTARQAVDSVVQEKAA